MATYALSALLAITASVTNVLAQNNPLPTFPATPLASLHFAYPSGLPYQAAEPVARGSQTGYNICNATTENQNSLCQTSFVNHIDDFCLWAPPNPNSTISDTEADEVAWCTKKGHGTRIMPEGTLKGVQYLIAPDYIMVAGFIDQSKINIAPGDYGGEMDPNAQDLNGNPMGGLMYTNAFNSNGDNATFVQVNEWNNFMGGEQFCIKLCNNNGPANNPGGLCQNRLDRLGCLYNAPNNAQNGTFEVCDSDDMTPPGVYTVNGVTSSYSQPPESLGPITTVPYTPVVPKSSNCVTYQSSALFTDAVAAPTSTGASSTGSGKSGAASGTSKGSSAGASPTGAASNGAGSLAVSVLSSIVGVAFSIAFLA